MWQMTGECSNIHSAPAAGVDAPSYVFDRGKLGRVVQSIVSLTSSLRGQLVIIISVLRLYNQIHIFFAEKMREAFSLQKLLTFFQQKIMVYLKY